MTSAYTLLLLAFHLLTIVSTTPNIPDSLKQTAISIANQAIVEANREIALSANQDIIIPVAPAPVYVPQDPITGSTQITNTMEDKSAVTSEIIKTSPVDKENSVPYGSYTIRLRVLDESGKTVNGAPVTIDAPSNAGGDEKQKTIDTRETPSSLDYYTSFEYVPTTKGKKTLTFTSGNLTNTLEITVK